MTEYVLIGVVDPAYLPKEKRQALEANGMKVLPGEDGFLRILKEREHGEEDTEIGGRRK
ncbi:hypothetical protein AALG83_03980 [Christensenellaceae bacterium 44-20]